MAQKSFRSENSKHLSRKSSYKKIRTLTLPEIDINPDQILKNLYNQQIRQISETYFKINQKILANSNKSLSPDKGNQSHLKNQRSNSNLQILDNQKHQKESQTINTEEKEVKLINAIPEVNLGHRKQIINMIQSLSTHFNQNQKSRHLSIDYADYLLVLEDIFIKTYQDQDFYEKESPNEY